MTLASEHAPGRTGQDDKPDSSLSVSKSFQPYYSPVELLHLVRIQASSKGDLSRQEMSESRIETWRQLACGYIERVAGRLGLCV